MTTTHRPLTVVSLLLSLFMGALEATVVSTAMPTVIGDLGGIQLYSWVFTAYLVAATVTVPIFGKLADTYGRKPVALFGVALFMLGSVASGASRSMTQLIAFRIVQGLGAGAMQPMALTIAGDIFSLEERARIQGVFGAVWGLAGLAGPMVGGLIVKHIGWRWVFYLNVPFGIASMLLLVLFFHERIEKKPHELDLAGFALVTALVLALLTSAHGGTAGIVGLVAAALSTVGFVLVERRASEPVIPLPLMRRRVIWVASLAGALAGGAMFAMVTYVPLFVQGVTRGSPTAAGSAIAPMVIGWPIASAIGGRLIPRTGFRPLVLLGLFISAAASIGVALVVARPDPSLDLLRIATGMFGVGLGFGNTSLLIAVQTSVDWKERGVATAGTMFFRMIGGALAVGVTGGVLTRILTRDPSVPLEAANALLGPDRGRSLSAEVQGRLGGALGTGLVTVLWICAGIGVAAFLVSLAFPRDRR
ncbi:MAG: MFS transporter [Deltaproteobacteria bacterium]|nr:MFS transporter [Deltaproteobacteria bacterium]